MVVLSETVVALRNRMVCGRIGGAETILFNFYSLRHLGIDNKRSTRLNYIFLGIMWSCFFFCGIRVREMYVIVRGPSLSLRKPPISYTDTI